MSICNWQWQRSRLYSGAGYLNVRFSQISLHGAAADRVILSDTELRAATADPELREIMTDDELRGVIADIETRTTEATQ